MQDGGVDVTIREHRVFRQQMSERPAYLAGPPWPLTKTISSCLPPPSVPHHNWGAKPVAPHGVRVHRQPYLENFSAMSREKGCATRIGTPASRIAHRPRIVFTGFVRTTPAGCPSASPAERDRHVVQSKRGRSVTSVHNRCLRGGTTHRRHRARNQDRRPPRVDPAFEFGDDRDATGTPTSNLPWSTLPEGSASMTPIRGLPP